MSATITAGLRYDMPAADYRTSIAPDGSAILSSTRAKTLLLEAGPAKYRHLQFSPEKKKEYDLGNAAHAFALGKDGDRLVLVDADSWRTKAAQEARDDAYAGGKTPLLPSDMVTAQDMATELRKHEQAMESLAGETEVSMFHQVDGGLWVRGRIDVMADEWTTDYKTARDASTRFLTDAFRLGYHMQAAWYRRMRHWLTGELLPYRIVAQESTAPYLVSVWEFDSTLLELGELDMDESIRIYNACTTSGQWPGYPTEIQPLTLPEWAMSDEIEID